MLWGRWHYKAATVPTWTGQVIVLKATNQFFERGVLEFNCMDLACQFENLGIDFVLLEGTVH